MKEFSATEKRFPRESFTQKLVKICERLDEESQREIPWKSRYFRGSGVDLITIEKLWVVGSYSRGALTCGDLDLVFSYTCEDRNNAYTKDIVKGFFGRVLKTSFYYGNPEVNSSGVPFPDAVEIWSGPGCDWMKAIESIIPDPSAGRAYRPSDDIPLRPAQLNTNFDRIDEVLQMLSDGLLESEFIPLSTDLLEPLTDGHPLSRFTSEGSRTFGSDTKKILPAIARVLENHDHFDHLNIRDRSEFKCGGTKVLLGRPYIPNAYVFDDISVKQVAMIPHLSKNGPNGVWMLRRGPNHPLVQSFMNKKAYICEFDGKPQYTTHGHEYRDSLGGIEIFSDDEAAIRNCTDHQSCYKEDSHLFSVKEVSGKALHDLMSGCDVVDINPRTHSINKYSTMIHTESPLSVDKLLSKLKDIDDEPTVKNIRKSARNKDDNILSFP